MSSHNVNIVSQFKVCNSLTVVYVTKKGEDSREFGREKDGWRECTGFYFQFLRMNGQFISCSMNGWMDGYSINVLEIRNLKVSSRSFKSRS